MHVSDSMNINDIVCVLQVLSPVDLPIRVEQAIVNRFLFCLNVNTESKERKKSMPTVVVNDMHVLAIYVTDLEKSEAFYSEHLGFKKIQDMSPGILMKAGEITLYLEAGRAEDRDKSSSTTGFCPCFATDSIKTSFEAISDTGIPIASSYQEFDPSFAFFRIRDPEGNLIEFAGTP